MFLHLWIIEGEEVALQCMRCFSSFGLFASVDIVPWAAKDLVHTASKLIVLCMGTFPTYQVNIFTDAFSSCLFLVCCVVSFLFNPVPPSSSRLPFFALPFMLSLYVCGHTRVYDMLYNFF